MCIIMCTTHWLIRCQFGFLSTISEISSCWDTVRGERHTNYIVVILYLLLQLIWNRKLHTYTRANRWQHIHNTYVMQECWQMCCICASHSSSSKCQNIHTNCWSSRAVPHTHTVPHSLSNYLYIYISVSFSLTHSVSPLCSLSLSLFLCIYTLNFRSESNRKTNQKIIYFFIYVFLIWTCYISSLLCVNSRESNRHNHVFKGKLLSHNLCPLSLSLS